MPTATKASVEATPSQHATDPELSGVRGHDAEKRLHESHERQSAHPIQPSADGQPDPRIAALAYAYWEERGHPDGSPEEDWFRAEESFRIGRHQ